MRIGVPREVKNREYRVALTPAGVHRLVGDGHQVVVETGAGLGSGISDEAYAAAGAQLEPTPEAVWQSQLVCKVKEPLAQEYQYLRSDQILFTYLHLAADRAGTQALLDAGTTAIAYETVRLADGSLPLLAPMSEVAGRLATQVGAYHLMRPYGGAGVLLGGVPGTVAGRVVVLGAGVAGLNAIQIAVGMRAEVTVLDVNLARLREIDQMFGGRVHTRASTPLSVRQEVLQADLVIGAVLVPGAAAPHLVDADLARAMRPGAVLVDIAVDQGGCFADTRPTTHDDPTFAVGDVTFYCVANMPGAVPVTSTAALTNATLPYLAALANRGWRQAMDADQGLAGGLMTHNGELLHAAVAQAHQLAVGKQPVLQP